MMSIKRSEVSQVMDYLASFSHPGFDAGERNNYLNFSMDRLVKTLALIPDDISGKSRVLELGASPYFMSLLLKQKLACGIDFANFFGDKPLAYGAETLASEKYRERHVIRFKHFNVEKDRFPYLKDSYDLVLFCEIIEHLTIDPVHTLVEINRLLRKGGYLIITTPNVLRYENVLKLIIGKNIHDHYSGYGAYGRHNREYTPRELRDLVEGLGFEVVKLYTRVTGSINITGISIKRFRRFIQIMTPNNRGSNIFLLARKVSDAGYLRPEWLFESIN
jgi:SAM-dependent methyltransferase